MISCKNLYDISNRLSAVRNCNNKLFGGINIILCGDFTQLPPVRAKALYSNEVTLQPSSRMTNTDQENAFGKIIWHQFTTVVILCQNMQQISLAPEDKAYRVALENMRYKACTEADVKLLYSLTSEGKPGSHKLDDSIFDNVSIITSRNKYRDKINDMGLSRYSALAKQPMTHFHSIDTLTESDVKQRLRISSKKRLSKAQIIGNNKIYPAKQQVLWNVYPHLSQHKCGILSLCIGMPVMIKKNIATKLCITNGAEAHVVGWNSSKHTINGSEYNVLETLFVHLKNPSYNVIIPGLPCNVVPIVRVNASIKCTLPNGSVEHINREQVDVIQNFAMTDYASQGRTRPVNVMDLTECRSHFSYYTCFSRSATVSGTVVIGGFNPNMVQGGISGWLRQEFRELEILDEITRLRHENMLHPMVKGI
ncbi:hypothetical protein M422DRAFT_163770 [Sphaerobolus stellatus SS14]|nr:hypothetical protein M422DRAFT_163770 [Sphaerobolus stellatus SS14]